MPLRQCSDLQGHSPGPVCLPLRSKWRQQMDSATSCCAWLQVPQGSALHSGVYKLLATGMQKVLVFQSSF